MFKVGANLLFEATDVYQANLDALYDETIRIIVNQGGTSSGKTYSILQVLFTIAVNEPKVVISVVGQDIPNLKKGALKQALDIYGESPFLQTFIKSYNKTDRIFEFHNGTIIEFNSYDGEQDAKSGKRDYLFVNEVNGVDQPIYEQLAMRTYKKIFLDYNPNYEFWVHTDIIREKELDSDARLIISDHRHNTFLDQKTHDRLEADPDPEHFNVYSRGITGRIEGLILRNWVEVERVPEVANFLATGLDFGFTNDPSACIDVFMSDGELYIDERFYETDLTNPDISDKMAATGGIKKRKIVADSAEPKSIKEIEKLGWYIKGVTKGQDSVINSIDIIKRYKLNVTRRSFNVKKELNSWKWKSTKNGKNLNEPNGTNDHAMAALRYVGLDCLSKNTPGKTHMRAA